MPLEIKKILWSKNEPLNRIVTPFREFMSLGSSAGILLILCMLIAMIWINSWIGDTYTELWIRTYLSITIGDIQISLNLQHWINDGLMVIFFFIVGLELKREAVVGELTDLRNAILPIGAAIGGMIFPVSFYLLFNPVNSETIRGWAVPMATDIAFALGILALFGSRAPFSLKVFITTLAIIDDIGAVLIIAFFYTSEIRWEFLLLASVIYLILIGLNKLSVYNPFPYTFLGIILWFGFFMSGVHATIAGVLLALTIPSKKILNFDEYKEINKKLLEKFDSIDTSRPEAEVLTKKMYIAETINLSSKFVQPPLHRLEHDLAPWVAFLIIPLFAIANAGVRIEGDLGMILTHPITLGIVLGLSLGKPLGVIFGTWVVVKLGISELPEGITWANILGVGFLSGVGFTMAHFISGLAFINQDFLDISKIAILLASLISGVAGYILLNRSLPKQGEQVSDIKSLADF
jgi:Na+:H+ antiporter, NhaA family